MMPSQTLQHCLIVCSYYQDPATLGAQCNVVRLFARSFDWVLGSNPWNRS